MGAAGRCQTVAVHTLVRARQRSHTQGKSTSICVLFLPPRTLLSYLLCPSCLLRLTIPSFPPVSVTPLNPTVCLYLFAPSLPLPPNHAHITPHRSTLLHTTQDIKPSNVLMHEDGRVVLADFEFSREIKVSVVSTHPVISYCAMSCHVSLPISVT